MLINICHVYLLLSSFTIYPNKYPVLDVPSKYIYKIKDPKNVLPKGNDSGIDKIYRVLQGSGFKHIKVSKNRSVIDDFVKNKLIYAEKPSIML